MPITAGLQVIPFSSDARISEWTRVGPSETDYLNIPDTVDGNGFITTPDGPDAQINSDTRQVFGRAYLSARYLGLRMRYSAKPAAMPIIKVFGRTRLPTGESGRWQILKNRLFDGSVTIQTDPSDVSITVGVTCPPKPDPPTMRVPTGRGTAWEALEDEADKAFG